MKNPYWSDFKRTKRREKLIKKVSALAGLTLVFNMSFLGVFFVAEPPVVAAEVEIVGNPELSETCGLDMVLIIDSSASIDTNLDTMKNAYDDFVDSLLPSTPTEIAVVEFDTTAHSVLDYTNDVGDIKDAIGDAESSGNTNWEDGLQKAYDLYDNRSGKPDLFIFASDGNPNDYGETGGTYSPSIALSRAIVVANDIKSSGIRIMTLGIGDAVDEDNLKAISSDDAYNDTNFGDLASDLQDIANDLCGGTITVTKMYMEDDTYSEKSNWPFSIEVTGGTVDDSPKSTESDGKVTFEITPDSTDATVTITEGAGVPIVGNKFDSAKCTLNGDSVDVTVEDRSIIDIEVGANDIWACTFYNSMFTGPVTSSISGCKYEDEDRSGVIDDGEQRLDDWDITLFQCTYTPLEDGENVLLENFDPAGLDSDSAGSCWTVATTTTVDGCYSFKGLDSGDYGVVETQKDGWYQTYPATSSAYFMNVEEGADIENINFANYEPVCGNEILDEGEACDDGEKGSEGCTADCTIRTNDITIKAYKVVCETEKDLPNWGKYSTDPEDIGPDMITATTASDYVAGNSNCELTSDWYFQWGENGVVNKEDGNHLGAASSSGWNDFDTSTGVGTPAQVAISEFEGDGIWVREYLQEGYVPYANPPGDVQDDTSAEMYCYTDIENYDNYDLIDRPEAGETYYCVAFNAFEEVIEQYGSLEGYKYEDQDGTTTTDEYLDFPGEGWTINLFASGTDDFMGSTTTDENGYYLFNGLTPGGYYLTEDVSGYWTQLSSPESIINVVVNETSSAQPFINYLNSEEPQCGNGIYEPENDEECDGNDHIRDGYHCNLSCILKKDSSGGGGGGGRSHIFTSETTEEPEVLGEEGEPSLSIGKTAAKTLLNPGDKNIEFTITITNNGNLTAYNVVMSDVLPQGMSFAMDASESKTWEIGDMEPGDIEVISYMADLSADAEEGEYINIATASADNNDPVSAEVSVNVEVVEVLAETGFDLNELLILLSILLVSVSGIYMLKRQQMN